MKQKQNYHSHANFRDRHPVQELNSPFTANISNQSHLNIEDIEK